MDKFLTNSKQEKWDKTLNRYSIFLILNLLLVVGINLSFVFFLQLISLSNGVRVKTAIAFFALLFGVGAILSVINAPYHPDDLFFFNSLKSLPNYLYWAFQVIFFIHYRNKINLDKVQRAIGYAIVLLIPYYHLREAFLQNIPIIPRISPNSVSFLVIAYFPTALYALMKNKGKIQAIILYLIVLAALLLMGRRSGFMLTALSGFGVLSVRSLSIRQAITSALLVGAIVIILNTPVVELFFKATNDRIYGLLYESEKIEGEDRSLLMRQLMVEKALIIYEKYPYTGIGILNFTFYNVKFTGSFAGAHYVLKKKNLNRTSPHNSYAGLLAEGGLFLIIPVLLMLGSLILFFLLRYNSIAEQYRPFFWGLIGGSIHFYFINSIVNSVSWFSIALCSAMLYRSLDDAKKLKAKHLSASIRRKENDGNS